MGAETASCESSGRLSLSSEVMSELSTGSISSHCFCICGFLTCKSRFFIHQDGSRRSMVRKLLGPVVRSCVSAWICDLASKLLNSNLLVFLLSFVANRALHCWIFRGINWLMISNKVQGVTTS